jgi:prolyl oligopeptidase
MPTLIHIRHTACPAAVALPLLIAAFADCGQQQAGPPVARMQYVHDVYHGVEVSEPYRWLENWEDSAVQKWSDAQNDHARAYLDAIPQRAAIRAQLKELYSEGYTSYYSLRPRNGMLFAMKSQPPAQQPFLVALASAHDTQSERVIIDLNKVDTTYTTAIDFFVPSRDGKLLAVSMSRRGSEKGTVYVYDAATGERLPDVVPEVNGPTAGGGVAWNADGSGFYYTHYPRAGQRPEADRSFYQQIYYHKVGTPTEEDTYSLGEDFPRIAEIELESSDDGRHILAVVSNGDGGEYAHYVLGPDGEWTQITRFEDDATRAEFGPDDALYLYSHKDAPRGQILRLPLAKLDLASAKILVPESDVTIREFEVTDKYIYVVDIVGGPSDVRVFDHKGTAQPAFPVPPISTVGGLTVLGGDRILFNSSSYTEPSAWYEYDPASAKATRTALYVTSKADYSNIEVVREFATSKDGTKVPLNILRRKGITLDGQNPAILYGYGGYGISQTPGFSADLSLWLNQGGVFAVANIRGGGEFGEEWHTQGNLTNKQNVFDDFAACAQHLIDAGYTNPSRLAIQGGSNGGLLMGAALTQHPELYRAVVSSVGIYDMLRVELDPNGEFNVTEFGTVKDPDQFAALYAYSPYHNVKDAAAYPAVLFLTGQNDGRVNPAHSRKMTARLQTASTSGYPILLRTSAETGHGAGTSLDRRIDRQADIYAFLFRELGMDYTDRPAL